MTVSTRDDNDVVGNFNNTTNIRNGTLRKFWQLYPFLILSAMFLIHSTEVKTSTTWISLRSNEAQILIDLNETFIAITPTKEGSKVSITHNQNDPSAALVLQNPLNKIRPKEELNNLRRKSMEDEPQLRISRETVTTDNRESFGSTNDLQVKDPTTFIQSLQNMESMTRTKLSQKPESGNQQTNPLESMAEQTFITVHTLAEADIESPMPEEIELAHTMDGPYHGQQLERDASSVLSSSCPPFLPPSINASYFRPLQFFMEGPGKGFAESLQKHRYDKSRFVRYQQSESPSSYCHGEVLFYHIHKNAGSTMARTKFPR